ncbi:MAG: hypothetical protein M3N38_11085 [Pseudomonadota bacterium]|nr:hypothetical protein [Pseudomonadota bacterium]
MTAYRRKAKQVRRLAGLALAFLLGTTSLASSAPREITVSNETIGAGQVLAPKARSACLP